MSLDLFTAMKARNPKMAVDAMIEKGATETKDTGNNTPLIIAILKNNSLLFDSLIKTSNSYAPDLNAVNNDGNTPLLIATTNGNVGFVNTLLNSGANPNVTDESGLTPLSIANKAGKVDIMKLLIARKADVNTTLEDKNSGQQVSQLQYAAVNGNINTVNAILSGNPDVNAADEVGNTALIAAAEAGKLDIVNALLAKGADTSITNGNGDTALSAAENNGHAEVQQALSAHTGGRRRGSKTRGRKTRGRKGKGKKRTVRR